MDNRYYFKYLVLDKAIFDAQEAQHMTKVRRCKVGDTITAFNGDGFDYNLEITEIKKDSAVAKIVSKTLNRAHNDTKPTVY